MKTATKQIPILECSNCKKITVTGKCGCEFPLPRERGEIVAIIKE